MKGALVVAVTLAVVGSAFAGGIVTNTNQSAQFIRTLSRNASTEIDATYFNPAGLTDLCDGLHVAFYNQTILQEKKVNNTFPLLNNHEFIGKVNVPVFPNVYAAYKKDKWAVAFGFGPNGGGGSADFDKGLPSFEMPIAAIPALVNGMGIPTNAYKADIAFKGSSVYYGFQLNAAYKVTDMISVSLGGRYIYAVNTYEGAIKGIQINPTFPVLGLNGSFIPATQFFQALSQVNPAAGAYVAKVSDQAVDAEQTASGITPIIGIHLKPVKNLSVGIKYEANTSLEFTNATKKDDSGLFPDGAKFKNDIPAIFAFGAQYAFLPKLRAALSVNYYFDKNADWGGREELVDSNMYETALGAEYDLTENLLVSIGYNRGTAGVSEAYQTDMSHQLSSNTVGLGLRYKLAKVWAIDLGAAYTKYVESTRKGTSSNIPYVETYNRTNIAVAVGLGYHF